MAPTHRLVSFLSTIRRVMRCSAVLALLAHASTAAAQSVARATGPSVMSDRQLYVAACANCHGGDGRGAAPSQLGFTDPPVPDFTDCSFASREAAQDWHAVVHAGGPVRAFSRRMPSFGEALSAEEIDRVVAYVRSLCTERSWPRGELNLPRPMATEKAFPEDEAIVTGGGVSRRGERAADMALVYERRFGARNQWELVIPFGVREQPGGGFTRAQVGDIGFALKRAFWHNSASGTILSGLAEVTVPIGDPEVGMGAGTTVFEPALLLGQTLGDNSFVQAQAGLEIGADKTRVEHEAFWRAAFGTTIASGFGRAWSPMVEFLGARPLEGRQPVEWDMIPQIQVSLTKRQHILASVGVRLPMTDRATRPRELLAYVLWDWFDGGLLDGWW